jgi:hypothetical protein
VLNEVKSSSNFSDLHTVKDKQGLSNDCLRSLKNIFINDKILRGRNRLQTLTPKLSKMYEAGDNILNLASDNNLSPIKLLHSILMPKYSPSKLLDVFNNVADPRDLLTQIDYDSLRLVLANDISCPVLVDAEHAIAADNEKLFIDYFRESGIKFYEQEELVTQQKAKYGRAIITPDILFIDPVYINGIRVYWLEYKNYVGTEIDFLYSSNIEQASKYYKEWGRGAICYKYGVVDRLFVPGAILLSGEEVPVFDRS